MKRVQDGFRVNYSGQETFVVTERKRLTKALARKVCKAMDFPEEDWMVTDMQGCMTAGRLETEMTARHGTMYTVTTDGYRNTGIEEVEIIYA